MKLRDGREIPTDRVIEGRYNVYDCAVGHALLSLDVDPGVTPMFMHCPDHPGVTAGSRCYPAMSPERIAALLPVRAIWRKPTSGEMKRERRESGRDGHYASGGLSREWVP